MQPPGTGTGNKSETGESQRGHSACLKHSHPPNEASLENNLNIFAAEGKERNLIKRNKRAMLKPDWPDGDKLARIQTGTIMHADQLRVMKTQNKGRTLQNYRASLFD